MSGSTYYQSEWGNLSLCTRQHHACPCKRNKVSLMSIILFPVYDFNNDKDVSKLIRLAMRRERNQFCQETLPLTACFKPTTHWSSFLTGLKTTDGERSGESDWFRTLYFLVLHHRHSTLCKLLCIPREWLNKLPWRSLQSRLSSQC